MKKKDLKKDDLEMKELNNVAGGISNFSNEQFKKILQTMQPDIHQERRKITEMVLGKIYDKGIDKL